MKDNTLQQNQTYKKVFIAVLAILLLFTLVGLMMDYDGDQANIFFLKTGNYLADYINVAKYSATRDPYFDTTNGSAEHAYFPLTYVLFYFLSMLSNYTQTDSFTAGNTHLSLAEINTMLLVVSIVFFIVLRRLMKGQRFINDILTLSLFGTGVFIFSMERGNVILLAVICVAVFLGYYNSENRVLKHISFICLAIAAALKGYPALLGILLVYEKRWKDAAMLALYGVAFCFLPFLFLEHGLENIPKWLDNLKLCNEKYTYGDFPRYGFLAFLIELPESMLGYRDRMKQLLDLANIGSCALMAAVTFFQPTRWKKALSLILILVLFPVNSCIYCGLYIFPVIMFFFDQEKRGKFDFIYLVLFLAVLNPYQIIAFDLNLTWMLSNIAMIVMFVLLLVENSFLCLQQCKTLLPKKTIKEVKS